MLATNGYAKEAPTTGAYRLFDALGTNRNRGKAEILLCPKGCMT
jgi:hypothetical protein